MTAEKSLTGKEIARLFEQNGWILDRVKGSHYIYRKKGISYIVSIPVHAGKTLKKGTQKSLLDILKNS